MYSLRHTYATQMVSAGMKYPAVAQQLGYSLKTFINFYVHALQSDVADVGNYDFLKNNMDDSSS